MCIVMLTGCQQQDDMTLATGVLELELSRAGHPAVATRAVDDDLCVDILDDEGTLLNHYAAGTVPAKIVLAPGNFVLRAYTDNQTSWPTANSGKGTACYYAETTFSMENDMVFRMRLDVPMTNYAVSLALPEHFHELFSSYTFTLHSGTRTVTINEGEKAYFAVAEGGFSYALRATNTDNVTHSHSAIDFPDIEAGKVFTVSYSYDSNATSGGVDIIITDDMETENTDISL